MVTIADNQVAALVILLVGLFFNIFMRIEFRIPLEIVVLFKQVKSYKYFKLKEKLYRWFDKIILLPNIGNSFEVSNFSYPFV